MKFEIKHRQLFKIFCSNKKLNCSDDFSPYEYDKKYFLNPSKCLNKCVSKIKEFCVFFVTMICQQQIDLLTSNQMSNLLSIYTIEIILKWILGYLKYKYLY